MRTPTVLVVDDDPSIRRLLAHLFEAAGYAVREAGDGAQALGSIRTLAPDVCVLDIMMPMVDGWQVLSEVRADPATSELPVIVLTARSEPRARLRGWELGCDAFMPKPFDPSACLDEVRSVLARDGSERAAIRKHQREAARAMLVKG